MKLSEVAKQEMLNAVLQEFGVADGVVSYPEGVAMLRDHLRVEDGATMEKKFGKYAIVTNNFECITEEELEEGRKILAALNKGKLFSRAKIYVRTFATANLGQCGMVALTAPKQILWEVSNVSDDAIESVRKQISAALGMSLSAC